MRERTYTLEQLIYAVSISFSWAETLRNMDLSISGGSVKSLQDFTKAHNVDTKHFLGLKWAKGRKRPELKKEVILEEILVKNSSTKTQRVKQLLFEYGIKEKLCEWCKLDTWRGIEISLELDHINGDNRDNELVNLRILCPNCHAQTDTYRGRNVKRKRIGIPSKKEFYCSCGNATTRNGVSCRDCYLKSRTR